MDQCVKQLQDMFEKCQAELNATRFELEANFSANVCFPQEEQSQSLPKELHPLQLLQRLRKLEVAFPELHKKSCEIVEGWPFFSLHISSLLFLHTISHEAQRELLETASFVLLSNRSSIQHLFERNPDILQDRLTFDSVTAAQATNVNAIQGIQEHFSRQYHNFFQNS